MGDIPKHNYSFHVNPGMLLHAVEIVMETMNVNTGVMRDVRMSVETFSHMDVYENGRHSIDDIFISFKKEHPPNGTDGTRTNIIFEMFNIMMKFLTVRGETKEGLSSYYINLLYNSKVFCITMESLGEKGGQDVMKQSRKLVEEWKDNQRFII